MFVPIFQLQQVKTATWQSRMRKYALFFVASLLAAFAGLVISVTAHVSTPAPSEPLASQAAGMTWDIQCLDCTHDFTAHYGTSLRLDSSGRPHIAYGGKHLYYAWYNGVTWQVETIDTAPEVTNTSVSLDLDQYGNPHISYLSNDRVLYVRWTGSTWLTQTVASQVNVATKTSLALDSARNPHIIYDNKYARWTGSTWIIQTWPGSVLGTGGSLVLDTGDNPHISYTDYFSASYFLAYAHWTGSDWVTQTVGGVQGRNSSLALDSAGQAHIAYVDGTTYGIGYAHWSGSAWATQTVTVAQGWNPSLALDSAGIPNVSYASNSGLIYAGWISDTWDIQSVASNQAGSMLYSTLSMDNMGNPHIGYQDVSGLVYTHRTGGNWSFESVDSNADTGHNSSLALDALTLPHIGYYDASSRDIKYAHWTGSTWVSQTVDTISSIYVPIPSISLALDDAGNPHIGYANDIGYTSLRNLKYAYWTGSAWITQTADVCLHYCDFISLALDSAGNPHLTYQDEYWDSVRGFVGTLRYVRWTGSAWVSQTVDSGDRVGYYASLVLDTDDNPHISYCHLSLGPGDAFYCDGIKYAHWTGSAWDIQTVSDGSGAISLALDSSSRPHISYTAVSYDVYPYQQYIRYARQVGGAWNIQTVATSTLSFGQTRLMLRAGVPHIGYIDGSGNLVYAVWTGAAWATQTVDSGGDISMVIDNGGNVHLSYYSPAKHGLAYAVGGWPQHVYAPLALNYHNASGNLLLMHLDEPQGSTCFADASGVNSPACCIGTACPTAGVSGKINTALRFYGNDYVSLGNPPSLDIVGAIALEAWVNVQATDGIRDIIAHGYTITPSAEVFLRVMNGEYQVGSWDGIGHRANYAIPAGDVGNWVHLVGVYDGAAWRLYRNGVEVSSTASTIGSLSVSANWAIGASGAGNERFFQGDMDEVIMYNRALSPQEVWQHYAINASQR